MPTDTFYYVAVNLFCLMSVLYLAICFEILTEFYRWCIKSVWFLASDKADKMNMSKLSSKLATIREIKRVLIDRAHLSNLILGKYLEK